MPSRSAVLLTLALTLVLVPAAAAKKGNAGYQTGYDDWRTLRAAGRTPVRPSPPDGSLTLAASGLASGTDIARAPTTAATTTTAAPTWSARRSRPRLTTSFGFTEAIASWNAATPGRQLDRDLDPRADRRPLDEVVQPRRLGVGRDARRAATRCGYRATPTVSSRSTRSS